MINLYFIIKDHIHIFINNDSFHSILEEKCKKKL